MRLTDAQTLLYMVIGVDFDGTIVEDRYPEIGPEIPFATDTLRMLIKQQHRVILWTVREGELLKKAVDWCRERGVEFYSINKDYPEEKEEWNNHFSRKIKANVFIDSHNVGGIPEWGQIYHMINDGTNFKTLVSEASRTSIDSYKTPKNNWKKKLKLSK